MTRRNTKGTNSGKSSDTPLDDMGLSRQEVIEMGAAASTALNHPIYNAAHQMSVHAIIEEWAATEPREVQKREGLWNELQGLGKGALRMVQMVERAKEVLERQENEQTEEQREYFDRQGFNLDEMFARQSPDQFQ